MGTHISRVKSVDLDSWTDEQMQSILNWGNARANKYWEAKLAAGHAPSEAKIENFIRTKYELKRWVMDGPMPDPSTLDAAGDEDVPLSIVKEKQVIAKKESARRSSIGQPRAPAMPVADLIGGDDPAPPRASTGGPPGGHIPAKAEPAAPRTTSTRDSLLGLDFLGGSTAPPRPASTPGQTPGGQSRPDLKQSILSLYASAPKSQPQPQQQQQSQHSFGHQQQQQQQQQPTSAGGFNDAFSSLSISNKTSPPPAADPFASFGSASSSTRATPQASNSNAFGGLSGGGFFDARPAQPSPPSHQSKPSNSSFGGFPSFTSPQPTQTSTAPKPQPASSAMGDLFDLSSPVTQTSPPPAQPTGFASPPTSNSVFNLSSPQNKVVSPSAAPATTSNAFGSAMSDAWGGNEWATSPKPVAAPAAPVPKSPAQSKTAAPAADFGWGTGNSFASTPVVPGSSGGFNPAPKVTADEEFGGWTSSAGTTNATTAAAPKSGGGFGGDDDLFSNVWQ